MILNHIRYAILNRLVVLPVRFTQNIIQNKNDNRNSIIFRDPLERFLFHLLIPKILNAVPSFDPV